MSIRQESAFKYPDILRRFRQRHDEFSILKPILKELATNEDFIKDAETALSVGTGFGQYDIEFFQYFSKLKKLIIVEKDPDCVKELMPNLKSCFGDKVEFEIYEMPIEKFMKEEASSKLRNKLDVVASFHSLYFLNSDDRKEFFRLCFDSWLKPDKGKLLVLNAAKDFFISKYYEELADKIRPFQDSMVLRQELNEMSVIFEKNISYTFKMDLKEYDQDLRFLTKYSHKEQIEDEEMEKVVRKVSPDGYEFNSCDLFIASQVRSA